jgi:hypothetical protein
MWEAAPLPDIFEEPHQDAVVLRGLVVPADVDDDISQHASDKSKNLAHNLDYTSACLLRFLQSSRRFLAVERHAAGLYQHEGESVVYNEHRRARELGYNGDRRI